MTELKEIETELKEFIGEKFNPHHGAGGRFSSAGGGGGGAVARPSRAQAGASSAEVKKVTEGISSGKTGTLGTRLTPDQLPGVRKQLEASGYRRDVKYPGGRGEAPGERWSHTGPVPKAPAGAYGSVSPKSVEIRRSTSPTGGHSAKFSDVTAHKANYQYFDKNNYIHTVELG